jgi:elongation factor Ts
MAITAQLVKELREMTGAGMMDAKKALTETEGDMEAAVDWLRTKGLAKAAKKADRVAAEGLVGVAVANGRGVAVEVNSETDFVAKNADFQALVRGITAAALGASDVETLKTTDHDGKTVAGHAHRRHRDHRREHDAAPHGRGRGRRRGGLRPQRRRRRHGQDRRAGRAEGHGCGHRQAACDAHRGDLAPLAVEADLDPAVLEREREVQTQKALEENAAAAKPKPDAVIHNNIIPGRMKKFLEEVTLLSQKFVMNPDITVEQAAKDAGVEIVAFARIAVGEGIEKKQEDFAAEVAKVASA